MNQDLHTLAGAYVLDALPEEEVEDFRAHLAECAACRQEVAELQATATHLGLSAAERPPAHLRSRVLAAAQRTRQVPPLLATADPSRVRRRRLGSWLAAAAAVVLVAAGGAWVGDRLDEEEPPASQLAGVLEAPDAHATSADLAGGGSLTVIRSQQKGGAVVIADDLPGLSASQVYQFWLIDPEGDPRSAGVLLRGAGRAGGAHLISSVRTEDKIAVTREPAGGSERPTGEPLAVLGPT